MRTQKITAFLAVLAVVFQLLIPNGFAVYEPVIKVEDVTALKGTNVTVPVKLTGNTGICGAVMYITYDEALTLTAVTKGEALPGLAMTPPGDLSKNPVAGGTIQVKDSGKILSSVSLISNSNIRSLSFFELFCVMMSFECHLSFL